MRNNGGTMGKDGEQGGIMGEQWGIIRCNEMRIMSSKTWEEWGRMGNTGAIMGE